MPGNFILRFSLIGLVFMGWSMTGMGNDGKPHPHFHLNRDMVRFFKDSLPDSKKETVENADTKKTELIKEVPKSRKQVKPIAVPTSVGINPVQVIKPKIIKPILKPVIKIK